jgi:hypothetical protein
MFTTLPLANTTGVAAYVIDRDRLARQAWPLGRGPVPELTALSLSGG